MTELLFLVMAMVTITADTGERISRTSTIILDSDVEKVFPLFGPIREKEWADGWEPEVIYGNGELVAEHMVFRTKGRAGSEPYYLWTITTFNPELHKIEYTVSTQNRVWFITVSCTPLEGRTQATISYTFTSINDEGKKLNRESVERMFAHDLKDWEHAINYYLKSGTLLKEH